MIGRNIQRIAISGVLLLFTSISFRPPLVFAADSTMTFGTQYRQHHPISLDLPARWEISSLDPALVSDSVSIHPIENLFLRLTDFDSTTEAVIPELASEWDVSNDGLIWTFHLRSDVNWMRYDPESRMATTIRPVVAADFEFGIKRACDPRLGGYYGRVIARVIAGCEVVNQISVEEVTDALVFGDTVQVSALDDTTLQIALQFPAAYFLSMTTMWVMSPLPSEVVEMYGDGWTLAGNIVTNGPYFLHENIMGVGRTFIRNSSLAADLRHGDGNIDVVRYHFIEDGQTSFALYQDNLLDVSEFPAITQQGVLVDYAADLQALYDDPIYSGELRTIHEPVVFYFGFTHDKPPFDNVHLRRAFSAIIDRDQFVLEIQLGRGVPMIHFTPPGMLHAPPIDEIGVGFDPDYAREQMALGGYPNCADFPPIEIETYQNRADWGEFLVSAAVEHLGCAPTNFLIVEQEFVYWPGAIDPNTPAPQTPHVWTLGWGPDYPDANNWIKDVMDCRGESAFMRECSDIDEMIEAAAIEHDPSLRAERYRQIEEAFFGAEGEFPMAPIYMRAEYYLIKSWYSGPFETDGLFNGVHWEAYSIDMAAKLAARQE